MNKRTFKDTLALLNEDRDFFPVVDVIKLDPDRVDSYDIVNAIIPVIIKIAYTRLALSQRDHARTGNDEKFDFSPDALEEIVEDLVEDVCNKLKDLSRNDIQSQISGVEKDFPEKLER